MILTLLCMTCLLGFVAFAADVGTLLHAKRNLQIAADSAAIAGAAELNYGDMTAAGRGSGGAKRRNHWNERRCCCDQQSADGGGICRASRVCGSNCLAEPANLLYESVQHRLPDGRGQSRCLERRFVQRLRLRLQPNRRQVP